MKLKDPISIRELLLDQKGYRTIDDVAKNLKIAKNTASRALRGEAVRMMTIKQLAKAVDRSISDIAELVEEK